MFELPPFWDCPKCKEKSSLGVLSVRANSYVRRCKNCRFKSEHSLNAVDKRVIYIDQFALSEMVKSEQPGYSGPHQHYWKELLRQIRRVVILQQAVFPDSNVHQDESLLSKMNERLRDLYESISGDVSLQSDHDIVRRQLVDFAESWKNGRGIPELSLQVDDIVYGDRSAWLSKLRVSVNTNYSMFVDGIRASRDAIATEMVDIFAGWAADKHSFDQVVKREAAAFGVAYIQGFVNTPRRIAEALSSSDPLAVLNATANEANVIFGAISRVFEDLGTPEAEISTKVAQFLRWDGLHQLPWNNISSHLYAAIARKAAAGQKRPPSRGMTNDVRVISSYAPYVDAMFIDNECAGYLAEEPLRSVSRLPIRAEIFSLRTKDQFLHYLRQIELDADPVTKAQAHEVYGGFT